MIFDDSRIQNLVNAYLEHPRKFNMKMFLPNLPKHKVVGLVTIKPKKNPSFFKKVFIPLLTVFLFE
jgi:hypothetical protein